MSFFVSPLPPPCLPLQHDLPQLLLADLNPLKLQKLLRG